MTEVPALAHLMGTYFHQDWDVDGTEWDVIDLFVREEPAYASVLPAEIDETLAAFSDESDLRSFVLDDLGACYLADADGGTFRTWLIQIADRVRAAT